MDKVPLCLDLDALRSFVTGIESGSFARAAQQLCRSTSAVSAQLKKLEAQCATPLVSKQGRRLQPTASGELLLSYARRILALNDEAFYAVKGELLQGEVRLGMQEDFGESLMPGILSQLSRQHPGLKMTARIDRNRALTDELHARGLDMALLWQPEACHPNLLRECELEWISHQDFAIRPFLEKGEPLPLVMFETPCIMRERATAALDRAGIPWRIVFISYSLGGIWAAVQAGLGITVRTRVGMPENLQRVCGELPSPGSLGIELRQTSGPTDAARQLLQQLIEKAVVAF